MSANKQPGVWAALCEDTRAARDGVHAHNMNLLIINVLTTTYEATVSIVRSFLTTQSKSDFDIAGLPVDVLAIVVEHIRHNLNQPLDVAALAKLAGMSPSHFSKLFKISFGFSPHQFILHQRVERSKVLLLEGNTKIVDVAFEVGFETQAHFTTVFGNLVGVTPRQFRYQVARRSRRSEHGSLFLVPKELSVAAIKKDLSPRLGMSHV
jgi:AraC-like DNA-binding protein